jgi:hypothetical protein
MEQRMTDLKPCPNPWCGSSDLEIITEYESGPPSPNYVLCKDCGFQGPSKLTKQETKNTWNTRPEHPAEKALRELINNIETLLANENIGSMQRRVKIQREIKKAKEAFCYTAKNTMNKMQRHKKE